MGRNRSAALQIKDEEAAVMFASKVASTSVDAGNAIEVSRTHDADYRLSQLRFLNSPIQREASIDRFHVCIHGHRHFFQVLSISGWYPWPPQHHSSLQVYDVTKFLEDHPGGDDVLLSATGKDATDDFEDVGHSTTAKSMMDEFYVGNIDKETIPSKVEYKSPNQAHYNQDKTPEFIIKILQFLVPLVILGIAVGIRLYTNSL